jgi:hypothetical protein
VKQCWNNIDIVLRQIRAHGPAAAGRVAGRAFASAAGDTAGPIDLNACCALVGASPREADLGAARGGLEGMLVPLEHDRFRIAVDPTPRGGWGNRDSVERRSVAQRRWRFRVAHEIGHTLFYSRSVGTRPRRLSPCGSAAEETFCDEFAGALLVPRLAGATAAEIVAAAQERDVSLEVAVRVAAAAAPRRQLALWHWSDGPSDVGGGAAIQWATERVPRMVPHRTRTVQPDELARLLTSTRVKLGHRFSFEVLASQRQALAALS